MGEQLKKMVPDWMKNASTSAVVLLVMLMFNFMLDMRSLDRIDQQDVLEEYQRELKRHRETERQCIQMQIHLNRKIDSLLTRVKILEIQ